MAETQQNSNNSSAEDLQKKIDALEAENDKLATENKELKSSSNARKEEVYQFSGDGDTYEFVCPAVKLQEESGSFKVFTAKQLVATAGSGKSKKYVHEAILAKLVSIGSGVIKKKGGK